MRTHHPSTLGAAVALASTPPDMFPRRAVNNTTVEAGPSPPEECKPEPETSSEFTLGPGWRWADPPLDTAYFWNRDCCTSDREWEPQFHAGVRQPLSGAERARRKARRRQAARSRSRNRR